MSTLSRFLARPRLAALAAAVLALPLGCSESPSEPVVTADVDGADGAVDATVGDDADTVALPDAASDGDTDAAGDGDADGGVDSDVVEDDVSEPDGVELDAVDSDAVEPDEVDVEEDVDADDGAEVTLDVLEDTDDGSDGDIEDVEAPVDVGPLYDAPLGIWSTGSPLPSGRERAAYGTHGGALWVAGGSDTLGAAKQDFYVYSVSGGVWGAGKVLPTARHSAIAAVASGRLYVAGGKETLGASLQVVERYNPGDQSWVSPPLPMLPTAGCCAAAVGVGKALWTVGGESGATLVRSFDPGEGVWKTEAPMAHGRSYPAVAHLPGPDGSGGELVVFGGAPVSAPTSGEALVTTVERYSFETGAWVGAGEAPFARYGLAAATAGGRIWIFGGTDENGLVRDTIWVWDPALGFAEGQTMPRPRSFHGALSTVEGIWLVGGRYATPSAAGANVALELQVDRLTL